MRGIAIITIGIVMCALFLFGQVHAYQNEPGSFRGVDWGRDISSLPDMAVVSTDSDHAFCLRTGDKMSMGEAVLDEVVYVFYKGRFANVMIKFQGSHNFHALKDALVVRFGKGEQANRFMDQYGWVGPSAIITLDFSGVTGRGHLSFGSTKLYNEEIAEKNKKARSAKDDM